MPRLRSSLPRPTKQAAVQPEQSAMQGVQKSKPAALLRSPPWRVKVGSQWLPKPPPPVVKRIPWRHVESSASATGQKQGLVKKKNKKKKKRRNRDQSRRNLFANLKGQFDETQEWKLKGCNLPKWTCEGCAAELKKKAVLFGFRMRCPFCRAQPPPTTRRMQEKAIRNYNKKEFERQSALRKQLAATQTASSSTSARTLVVRTRKITFLNKIQKKNGLQRTNVARMEDINARIHKLEKNRDNLSELIDSLSASRQRRSEEAQSRVLTLIQQSEQAKHTAEEDLVRLMRLKQLVSTK